MLNFEAQYSNGKIWNGKGYNMNSNIDFEIKRGKGYMKEYDYEGKIKFEGEYVNGERHGEGKEYLDGKLIFEGEYLDRERNSNKISSEEEQDDN